jgi:hypothetical protein
VVWCAGRLCRGEEGKRGGQTSRQTGKHAGRQAVYRDAFLPSFLLCSTHVASVMTPSELSLLLSVSLSLFLSRSAFSGARNQTAALRSAHLLEANPGPRAPRRH